jgi:hypothetical protein
MVATPHLFKHKSVDLAATNEKRVILATSSCCSFRSVFNVSTLAGSGDGVPGTATVPALGHSSPAPEKTGHIVGHTWSALPVSRALVSAISFSEIGRLTFRAFSSFSISSGVRRLRKVFFHGRQFGFEFGKFFNLAFHLALFGEELVPFSP